MGETSGYFGDPKSAREVLKVLTQILDIELDFSDLEEKAKEIEDITGQIKEEAFREDKKEDLEYIG